MTDQEKSTLVLLPPLKRAELFESHLSDDGLTKTQIAQKYTVSLPYVSNTLRLLKLPPIIKEGLVSKHISEGHARALLTSRSHEFMVRIYKKILIDKISVRETERLARSVNT